MTMRLTAQQERRVQAVISRGVYSSIDELMEAALTAVEQRTLPASQAQRKNWRRCSEGLASKELSEQEFWNGVIEQTDAVLNEQRANSRS